VTAGAWRRAVVGAPHTSLAISQQAPRRHETTPLARIINHPIQSSGCGKPSPIAAGDSADRSMSSGGIQRLYRLHIPQRYQPRHAYPLVLSFHGNGSTALQQERRTGFSALADHIGFVVIYPQGTPGPNGRLGWSSGGPGHPVRDDVLFVSDLLTAAQSLLCIDPLRIYATGFSNGGGMTALLACRLAGRIAAYAPVSGSYYPVAGGCAPGRPVALLEVHGSDDRTVPYTGNPKTHLLAVSVWLAQWARRDACASSPQTQSLSPSVTRLTWTGCRGQVAVEHLRVQGGQHVWPPALLPASGDPNALPSAPQTAQMIWAFLSHYTLPTALA
jgi:polyhydroxybutyrate depolymerase